MNRTLNGAVAGLTAIAAVLSATPAAAQRGHHDRNDRHDWHGNRGNQQHRWHTWGGSHGYNGYRGRWRSGQRFSHWNDRRYYISDYGRYNLPPPRRGYRYYRDDNGDIIMAAIGTGIIGLILGSQLGR